MFAQGSGLIRGLSVVLAVITQNQRQPQAASIIIAIIIIIIAIVLKFELILRLLRTSRALARQVVASRLALDWAQSTRVLGVVCCAHLQQQLITQRRARGGYFAMLNCKLSTSSGATRNRKIIMGSGQWAKGRGQWLRQVQRGWRNQFEFN